MLGIILRACDDNSDDYGLFEWWGLYTITVVLLIITLAVFLGFGYLLGWLMMNV